MAVTLTQDPAPLPAGAGSSAATSYDAVPYSVGAFPQTRPDRLATIATLFGMTPVPPSHCRVLELGCAAGGELLPVGPAPPRNPLVRLHLFAPANAHAQNTP